MPKNQGAMGDNATGKQGSGPAPNSAENVQAPSGPLQSLGGGKGKGKGY